MKKQFLFFLILSFTLLGLSSNAQSRKEQAVAKAVESLRIAMINADSSALNKLTQSALSYGHSSGRVEDKKTFIANIVTGASDFVTIDLTDQTIKVVDKTAIVRHVLSATTNDNGKPGSVKLGILTVWEKDHGKWKLLARQAVRI